MLNANATAETLSREELLQAFTLTVSDFRIFSGFKRKAGRLARLSVLVGFPANDDPYLIPYKIERRRDGKRRADPDEP